jgi:glycosyltransferase involved in cell wall biosynthesis
VVRILYLTYDGLTSLIGQSQVWPYLEGLAAEGHRFEVVSFEQRARLTRIGARVAGEVAGAGIGWHPRPFRSHPPLLAKLMDQRDMRATARRLAGKGDIDVAHARSYVAADAALALKRSHGVPFIFDMRGFWVDERRESGRWRGSSPLWRRVYRQWKAKEAAFLREACHIVVLAEAARRVVESWPDYRGQPVTVIPCCIDHEAFTPATPAARAEARVRLGVGEGQTVLGYLGSIGTVYLLEDMLRFYARMRRERPSRFLLVGWHTKAEIMAAAWAAGLEIPHEEVVVQPAEHAEVPFWLGAADLAIAFRQPSFSSLGASPTKLGEYLALGLPVVVNDGVGDVRAIVEGLEAGIVLPALGAAEIGAAAAGIDRLLRIDRAALSARSRRLHDLPVALARYREVYAGIAARQPGAVA